MTSPLVYEISGAGNNAANGMYAAYGTRDGKPRYRMASVNSFTGFVYIVWDSGWWYVSQYGDDADAIGQILGTAYYFSNNNVPTPDLITTWTAGTLPYPTITDPNPPLDMPDWRFFAGYRVAWGKPKNAYPRRAYPLFGLLVIQTPACRTYVITAENRTLVIPAENRTYEIEAECRVYVIAAENRVGEISPENRTYSVTC